MTLRASYESPVMSSYLSHVITFPCACYAIVYHIWPHYIGSVLNWYPISRCVTGVATARQANAFIGTIIAKQKMNVAVTSGPSRCRTSAWNAIARHRTVTNAGRRTLASGPDSSSAQVCGEEGICCEQLVMYKQHEGGGLWFCQKKGTPQNAEVKSSSFAPLFVTTSLFKTRTLNNL